MTCKRAADEGREGRRRSMGSRSRRSQWTNRADTLRDRETDLSGIYTNNDFKFDFHLQIPCRSSMCLNCAQLENTL